MRRLNRHDLNLLKKRLHELQQILNEARDEKLEKKAYKRLLLKR